MNNLPPGVTNADVDAAAGHDELACTGKDDCRCFGCDEMRREEAAVPVCSQCGTDEVADLSWPLGYSDPRHYPPHYCAACERAVSVVTAEEFDRLAHRADPPTTIKEDPR